MGASGCVAWDGWSCRSSWVSAHGQWSCACCLSCNVVLEVMEWTSEHPYCTVQMFFACTGAEAFCGCCALPVLAGISNCSCCQCGDVLPSLPAVTFPSCTYASYAYDAVCTRKGEGARLVLLVAAHVCTLLSASGGDLGGHGPWEYWKPRTVTRFCPFDTVSSLCPFWSLATPEPWLKSYPQPYKVRASSPFKTPAVPYRVKASLSPATGRHGHGRFHHSRCYP